jgi:trans-aconitate methyltransferase
MSDHKEHWDNIYHHNSPLKLSWYKEDQELSMRLVHDTHISRDAAIIDVGGGASTLVDMLVDEGYTNVAVLDVAARALAHARIRLADEACRIQWYEEDVTRFESSNQYSLWHDRAVFHFLINKTDRDRYVKVLRQSLRSGGHLIMMTFAIDGPSKCSGLDIVQYDEHTLAAVLGTDFQLMESGFENHFTPAGKQQKFAYFRFVFKP